MSADAEKHLAELKSKEDECRAILTVHRSYEDAAHELRMKTEQTLDLLIYNRENFEYAMKLAKEDTN